jgi:hypothetical protein
MKRWQILIIIAVIVGCIVVVYFWADYSIEKDKQACMINPELIRQKAKVRDFLGLIYDGVEINTSGMDDSSRNHIGMLKMMADGYKSNTSIQEGSKGHMAVIYSIRWQEIVCEKHLVIPKF